MVEVLSVRVLESKGKILVLTEIDASYFLFPAESLIGVHECEIKKISSSGLIYQVSIIIKVVKIFIEVRQLGLIGV